MINKYIYLNNIYDNLLNGNITVINLECSKILNNIAKHIIDFNASLNDEDIKNLELLLKISNIIYDNTDKSILPLEDGVYDKLIVIYNNITGKRIIGSPPVLFDKDQGIDILVGDNSPIKFIEDKDNIIYYEDLMKSPNIPLNLYQTPAIRFEGDNKDDSPYITKRLNYVTHEYPELVGTLDKSKFVLNCQAKEKGVFDDSNVRILERDFFQKHISDGIYDKNRILTMVLELKYDGISVEAEVSNRILTARTRGEIESGLASDLTPILYGYPFTNTLGVIPDNDIIGMKFEAIITKNNLERLNKIKDKEYKNCRTGIVGIISSSDAYKYRNLITLVPLQTSLDIDRLTEINFINRYYANDEYLRYTVVEGDYITILYLIKKFLEEAEYMRPFLPFMYDGIVVSYLDDDIRNKLGRRGSVNLFSEAVKFNPLKKSTYFTEYTYTVGQDGSITPMINYLPVEFFGTVHTISTGHSYDRFKKLALRYGDIIDIEYVNDVMPYITKPDNSHNKNNTNPIIEFTSTCPACGSTELVVSPTGKTIYCTNIDCNGIKLSRLTNMMQKLNFKDFGEEYLLRINKESFNELMDISMDELKIIFPGEKLALKFMERVDELKTNPILDYDIIGSLGFTNIAKSTWKIILNAYTLTEILSMDKDTLYNNLIQLTGIGGAKANIIINELDYYMNDLIYINNMNNIIISKTSKRKEKIRFTGCRDEKLVEILSSRGYDIGEGAVTKDTDILIIPYQGYNQGSKFNRAKKYGTVKIIPIDEFKEMYL